MKGRFKLLEEQFRVAARKERIRGFLRRSALLGVVVCAAFLLLGAMMVTGIVTGPRVARVLEVLLWVGAVAGWFVIALVALGEVPGRPGLAASLEESNPELLDRIHTVVHLEKNRSLPAAAVFRERIVRQTQMVIAGKSLSIPLPLRGLLVPAATFGVILFATLWFHDQFRPWDRLNARQLASRETPNEPPGLEPPGFALPTNDPAEVQTPWGEVRITEPGRDTVITPADTFRLQVEAAANRPLNQVVLQTAVNGGEPRNRPFPPGAEPRYAVHQTNLSAAQLDLKPWDVMTYHGRAGTEDGASFESEIYFLEVQPLREELQRLQAGNGECYNLLSELTALIQQQQEMIRQTHRHLSRPHPSEELQAQDRGKLSETEQDLSGAVDHLAARIAQLYPEAPTAPVIVRLDAASLFMLQAGNELRTNAVAHAQGSEGSALGHLSAARQEFHRALVENPDAFRRPDEQTGLERHLAERLQEMAEFRDELKAAREWMRQAEKEQQRIASEAKRGGRTNLLQLANQEQELEKSLEDFREKHPRAFRENEPAADAARDALERAAKSLQQRSAEAARSAQAASEKISALREAMDRRTEQEQLAEALELRRMLEQQSRGLGQCQNPGGAQGDAAGTSPGTSSSQSTDRLSPAEIQQLVQNTKSTVRQLGQVVNENPGDRRFGEALRQALSPLEQADLARQLEDVAGAQNDRTRGEAAGRARNGVSKVVQAFDQGMPQALREARKDDALSPDASEALERARKQLEDLRDRLGNQDGKSTERDQQLWRDALLNLSYSLSNKGSGNEATAAIAIWIADELKNADPVDVARLGQLLGQLSRAPAEPPPGTDAQSERAAASNIDPQRLPAAYRTRIEEYFRKLSETR